MARRDSNPDPLDVNSSSRSTTLENTETTGSSGVTGTSGLGTSGTSGVSGTYGYGTAGAGTSGLGTAGTGTTNPTNWQRAGEESQTGASGAVTQVKEQAKGLASEAKQEVTGMASQAKEHVQNLVGERKDKAAEQIGSFANSLRDAARKLEDGEGGGATALGRYATTAADQVDRVSQYLRDRDLQSFVRDAETFARRHPDVFLGGTFIAGLILARFFKASDRRNEGGYNEDWRTARYDDYGRENVYGSSYGTGTSGTSYGGSYGNTYNAGTSPVSGSTTGSTAGSTTGSTTGSTYEGERSENTWTPGGPVPPVGG